MMHVRKTFLPNEMTTKGSISQPVQVMFLSRDKTVAPWISQHHNTLDIVLHREIIVSFLLTRPRPAELLLLFVDGPLSDERWWEEGTELMARGAASSENAALEGWARARSSRGY
jgi:hypothetical protein